MALTRTPFTLARALMLALAAILAVLALGACGGDDETSVPADAIAVVGDTEIPKDQFDELMARAEKSYENNKREFPKVGTPEYQDLKGRAVAFLVQRYRFQQAAEERDVTVSDEDVDKRIEQIKKENFEGKDEEFVKALAREGLNEEDAREEIKAQILQEKLFEEVTKEVGVSDADIEQYYEKNKAQFTQPASRDVRHILVKSEKKADELYAELQDGANFAKLAKENSTDTGSAKFGGKIPVQQGSTVPEFDKAAFSLDTNEFSKPIKTQFGWHIIMPISEVKPEQTQDLDDLRDSIRSQLEDERKNKSVEAFVKELEKQFPVVYAAGYEPPKTTVPTESGATSTVGTDGDTSGSTDTATSTER
jgi:parvulin-like peptidyl-prolyl isomerase